MPEVHKEVWCIKCKGEGHDKDHFLIFIKYITLWGPTPLRLEAQSGSSAVPSLWCAIFQVGGKHNTNNCHLLQKFT